MSVQAKGFFFLLPLHGGFGKQSKEDGGGKIVSLVLKVISKFLLTLKLELLSV